jgi:hypothetical protein
MTMKVLRSFFNRLRSLFRKEQLERDLSDELVAHLEMHIADNMRAGLSEEEARRAALLKLGGVEQTKESYRERLGLPLLESMWQDLRFAVRMLRKNPGFTTVSVLTLALGIGSATAIFSVIDGALLDPYLYRDAERLATPTVFSVDQFRAWRFPAAAFVDFKYNNHTFDDSSLRDLVVQRDVSACELISGKLRLFDKKHFIFIPAGNFNAVATAQ